MSKFINDIEEYGYFIEKNINFSNDFLEKLRFDVFKWVDICSRLQVEAAISTIGDGTAHHSLGGNDSIQELVVSHPFDNKISEFFHNAPYVLHACNPVTGAPGADGYIRNIHRDTATYIKNYRFRINVLLALEDFTEENGATKILPFPHSQNEKPSNEYFDKNCITIKLKKGQVLFFNSYLWHCGGENRTSQMRPAITLSYNPAFIKQQFDYVQIMGDNYFMFATDKTKQVLGYNSRVPRTLKEWYKPKKQRFYKADQG
jgi:ectoine hydroxylase-related dioxygenase (phytanoyl-CoA dioxygenase family)